MSVMRIFKEIERRAKPENKFEGTDRAFCVTVGLVNGVEICAADYIGMKPNEGFVELRLAPLEISEPESNRHVLISFDKIVYVRPIWL
jgi:hypothetical protein